MAPANTSYFHYRTPYGTLTIGVRKTAISFVSLGQMQTSGVLQPCQLSNTCATEVLEYLSGKRKQFDVPFNQTGTSFQKLVWDEVCRIPYGTHKTAEEIATAIGHPGAHRAVGQALRHNVIALLVPTHRVTLKNGKPWGTGKNARVRAALLKMEESKQS